MENIIECVPNFSEGKDQKVIQRIADAISSEHEVKLLHIDSSEAANRTVYTFAGPAEAVIAAAYRAVEQAAELIDMRTQQGEHPRIGACDVCPFIPIKNISDEDLIPMVDDFAASIATDFKIPVFMYEKSARSDERRKHAKHRIGEYEYLEKRINGGLWKPDFGHYFNAKTGGMVCGVRNFLVAYNINLTTEQVSVAKEIAYDLRELGRPLAKKEGKMVYKPGKLKAVKAIGWYIKDFDKVQVSINLTDYKATSLYDVFNTTKTLAEKYHTQVSGSELIGLIPKGALIDCGTRIRPNDSLSDKEYIQAAINELGLNELEDFDADKRILEYALDFNG